VGYLTEKIFDAVGRISQERGRSYFLRGAVKRIEGDAWRVTGKVQGSQLYEIHLSFAEDCLNISCSCPFFRRELSTCKHIWAVALAAERSGLLKGPASRNELEILEIDPELQPSRRGARAPAPKAPPVPSWKQELRMLYTSMLGMEKEKDAAPRESQVLYLIDANATSESAKLIVEVARRERKLNGEWSKLKTDRLHSRDVAAFADPLDRRGVAVLLGARQEEGYYGYSSYHSDSTASRFVVPPGLWDVSLSLMCATGRCFLRHAESFDENSPLGWDDGEAWNLVVQVAPADGGKKYYATAVLRRGECEMNLAEPDLLLAGGLVFNRRRIARLNDFGAFAWIPLLRERASLTFSSSESDEFLNEVLRFPKQPVIELPEELRIETVRTVPKPRLVIKRSETHWGRRCLLGELSFDYDGALVRSDDSECSIYQRQRRRLIHRDADAENAAKRRLGELGFRSNVWKRNELELTPAHLPKVVRALSAEGWSVEAEGDLYRSAGALRMAINSGVDWFELEGGAQFGGASLSLPKLLRAIRHGEQTVRLDDGSLGIIPEEWLAKYRLLAALGSVDGDRLRFTRPQIGLLDALIAEQPEISVDTLFERARREIKAFSGVEPADPPAQFQGTLRDYQREGLGWLYFLQRFGFGGCLADDMGLGKTIQVLALLGSRRDLCGGDANGAPRPSLVVVPRSLVFHWKKEAAGFAPRLRVLDHTGAARLKPGDHFDDYNVILTTYGTLRRDALQFKDQRFDYCILDEAQAIKNAGTLSAKAVRLLRADHRLAMSGTPVENHLGELWSLFEFLNPGMLGSASIFTNAERNPDEPTRAILRKALRPFILRRTKGQVATELPEKTEQTIYCDLDAKDKKLYAELRDYYRARLLRKGASDESGRFKIQVLEALLRLRQAACHSGLIDKKKVGEPSAKVDTLLAQLDQVLEEDHKVLVFSQFTSLLAIVRSRLDAANIPYAYLDGRTRDRQARVEQFQNDSGVKLFLISLKAGGLGLNLHAAEYVYLLDPWWNPAVEAQAIDRAHRIGQTRHVFAYRLIARDTVEEKVLALQQSKRDLADAIISADNSVMRNLTREDLDLLLS
jgi:SNF2 domain-containing protein/helicase-like protein/SWIM zinc finger